MFKILSLVLVLLFMDTKMIFDFDANADLTNWKVVDDTVMGGRSDGSFQLSADGHGLFSGYVTTENNGGFSSVRFQFNEMAVQGYSKVLIRLKGDGKNYQFRVKASPSNYYSYIKEFSTSGDWQEIAIPLNDMYPSFRGRKLDLPNFSKESISEVTFLIGNKRKENFELAIDKIQLVE